MREFRYEFIRTPLEEPLMRLRDALGYFQRRRHPELREIYLETGRINAVVDQLLRPDSNCIDIGCHYGSMLSRFCRLAPQGRHVAFEAIPAKARFLRRKFPEVGIHEVALSDHPGITRFYINSLDTGFSGLAEHGGGPFEQIDVDCARLDDVVPRDRRFDFLKLDVEGAELFVLRGAIDLLTRDRPTILFECGPSGPVAFGYAPREIYDLFAQRCGYSVFFLKDYLARGSPVGSTMFEEALVYPFKAFNWVAAPTESTSEWAGRN